MKITVLDNTKDEISGAIHRIMQTSYRQEAELIGAEPFPPLDRTAADIRHDSGTYFGALADSTLAGVLHLQASSISSLVVEPHFQRRGIASALIAHVLDTCHGQLVSVSTAKKNTPATSLYLKHGFRLVGCKTRSGIELVEYQKRL